MRTTLLALLGAVVGAGCGSETCDLPQFWSTATSGGLCQVNFFTDPEYAVYCAQTASGAYNCACGPVDEDPIEFLSEDFCDIDGEDRACAAIEACGFPL